MPTDAEARALCRELLDHINTRHDMDLSAVVLEDDGYRVTAAKPPPSRAPRRWHGQPVRYVCASPWSTP